MALTPIDPQHALQIEAGITGRKTGHKFEDELAIGVNALVCPMRPLKIAGNIHIGNPAANLVHYVAADLGIEVVRSVAAVSTGALATSEEGKKWLEINGQTVTRSKSDLVLTFGIEKDRSFTVGISTKQCNNKTPTNAQLYFTTAIGFAALLKRGGIQVSELGLLALRQFCGDSGYSPADSIDKIALRKSDPRRYFWEEIDVTGRQQIERVLTDEQDKVTRLLLQQAYADDKIQPDYLLHKTKYSDSFQKTEVAIYSIDELIERSRKYQGFATRSYSVRKGTYKDPKGVTHLAPRFGIVQMQRGGQKQHPTQLQFNLEAGYFYKLRDFREEEPPSHASPNSQLIAAERRSQYRSASLSKNQRTGNDPGTTES